MKALGASSIEEETRRLSDAVAKIDDNGLEGVTAEVFKEDLSALL